VTPKGPLLALTMGAALVANAPVEELAEEPQACDVELVVLGAGQDAGAPQIGNADDTGPRLLPSSLGLIDRRVGARYLFDATPAITEQLALLDTIEPPQEGLGVDGVFLTHAHIGHYLGLAYFGREAAGASQIPVYAMPRMAGFLRSNGPWSQLVELGNIEIRTANRRSGPLGSPPQPVKVLGGEGMREPSLFFLSERITATAIPAAHRDEFSETVAWVLADAARWSFLYLPDIDQWSINEDGSTIEGLVAKFDALFIDATFWDDNELLDENGMGRDMSEIPHPRVTETMDRLQHLPASERAKVHFIHYNHTNPIRDPDSAESREVIERGFNVARRGDRHCLSLGE